MVHREWLRRKEIIRKGRLLLWMVKHRLEVWLKVTFWLGFRSTRWRVQLRDPMMESILDTRRLERGGRFRRH